MSDIAQDGYGTVLKYNNNGAGYVALANLIDLDPPEVKAKVASFQPLNTNRFMRRGAQCGEAGDMKFTCIHGAGLMTTLSGLLFNNTLAWQIVLADGTTSETFAGVLSVIGRKYKAGEYDVIDITVSPDGAVTFAP